MSSDDPYSRLKALERMGVVADYSKLYTKTVVIIGIGGVGIVASEMLVRCGIGRLILIDFDTVEKANLNRLFYKYEHVGLKKVEAASKTLKEINPNVEIITHDINICYNYIKLLEIIKTGGFQGRQIDLLLSCVDNYGARVTISKGCTKSDQIWMNSGVSEDAMNGQIQTCIPGVTACFMCAPPFVVATNGDESEIKRGEVCVASLPTTMAVIAGLMVQNALKYLLSFGTVTNFLGYNSKQDYFPSYAIKPSPDCSDDICIELARKKIEEKKLSKPENVNLESKIESSESDKNQPKDSICDYGITVIASDSTNLSQSTTNPTFIASDSTSASAGNNAGQADSKNKYSPFLMSAEDSLEILRSKLFSLNTNSNSQHK